MAKTQEMEETADFDIDGPSLVDALVPILIQSNSFLKALANSQTFVTALCANPIFIKLINSASGSVVGSVITQGLSR